MASTGIERQSAVAERLAVLTARSKHINGEGYGTTRADPMMMAGAMAGLTPLQRELMHAKYMLDYRAQETLVTIYAATIARQYALTLHKATAVSRAAVHCVVHGSACKMCMGTGVMPDQRECKRCDGVGMLAVSDRERARVSGIERMAFQRHLAEIADNAETALRREESSALSLVGRNLIGDA
jgi:hypothetical protein